MQPGRQWKDRIELWIQAVKEQVYKPLGSVNAEVFFTMEELSCNEALQHTFTPIAEGTSWGKKWEYAWFQFDITIPACAVGKRVVCVPDVGAESLCYVKGDKETKYCPRGAFDKQHKEIILSRNANAGDCYQLILESYAGHGLRLESGGPIPPEVVVIEEPPMHQCKVGTISYGIWQEEAYQLYLDAFVLWDLYQVLDPKSLRAMEILDGLKQFTYLADVELSETERVESFVKARKVLQPLLLCKNGQTTPLMSICGQSHLDLAWLWPYAETRRKTARTYSNQLTLMEEYQDYQFLSCDPFVIEVLKEKYPEVYEQYLKKVDAGQMIPEGVTYVEPDINMICGEALFRHIIEGVTKFQKLSQTEKVKLLWLPDVFGFSAALPQVMKQCGIPYFATQKLLRQDPEAEAFPYNDFWWEGLDGTRVLSHIFFKNNTCICPSDIYNRWYEHRHQETGMDGMLYPFGYGDGGGGPTRDMVEIANRVENLEGIPKTIMESPTAYFERMEKNKYPKPIYRGELYLAWHRGTLTSQAALKKGNRYAETALKEAELIMALFYANHVRQHGDYQSDLQKVQDLWNQLLFLQFHDIFPGSSIERVNVEAKKGFLDILEGAKKICEKYQVGIGLSEDKMQCKHVVIVEETQDGLLVQNNRMKVSFASDGTVISMINLDDRKEYLHRPGNRFRLYKNVNSCYDAWEMGSMIYEEEVDDTNHVVEKLHVWKQYEDKVILSYKMKIHHSLIEQKIILHADETVIYFSTQVDWHERHKLLKTCFYPEVHTNEGISEIQYGYMKRSMGENHQFEKDQYEVCNHRYAALADDSHGLAILNDGKYGVHMAEREIALSLLRAPLVPDQSADEGIHNFTYACMLFNTPFSQSQVTKKAVSLQHMALHNTIEENKDTFNLLNWFQTDHSTILPDWCYKSVKQDNLIILRVYQSVNQESDASIRLPFNVKEVWEMNPYEEKMTKLSVCNGKEVSVSCKPFEVKTLGFLL